MENENKDVTEETKKENKEEIKEITKEETKEATKEETKETTKEAIKEETKPEVKEETKEETNDKPKKSKKGLNQAYQYTGGMDQASELTGRALRELSGVSVYDEKIADMEETLTQIDNLLNDFNREIADYLDDTDFDEETFYHLEKRLDEINHLKSKYGSSIEEILSACEAKQERLLRLKDYDTYLADLKEKVKNAEKKLQKSCEKVSDIRKKYAEKLVIAVTEALKDLNFLDVVFEMRFDVLSNYTANGYDDAEFMISTNPGEPVRPLGKVASGGELSRIMLAIKTVLADQDEVETLIFDEIDSGISGRTAQMVSEKMNLLGRTHQIICITHLPQIAAMADAHYLIEKAVSNGATVSKIRRLDTAETVDELSRMLGGVEITDKVRESAREMKELAAKKKK